MTKDEIKAKVDRLGELRAEKDVLKVEEKSIEADLKAAGESRYEGDYFAATVSRYERATIAWKKIAEKLKASDYLRKVNTKVSEVCTVKVVAHAK